MAESKIQIKIGNIEFTGEGEQEWIAKQLDKIIEKSSELVRLSLKLDQKNTSSNDSAPDSGEVDSDIVKIPLAKYLRDKNATNDQTKKFLATAVWLQAKGNNRLSTGDIVKALKESNQTKLTNPSVYLKTNIGKGYCEKDGKKFFVTEDGKSTL